VVDFSIELVPGNDQQTCCHCKAIAPALPIEINKGIDNCLLYGQRLTVMTQPAKGGTADIPGAEASGPLVVASAGSPLHRDASLPAMGDRL